MDLFCPPSPTEADQEQMTLMLEVPLLGHKRAIEVGWGCTTGSLDDDRLDSSDGRDVFALRICAT